LSSSEAGKEGASARLKVSSSGDEGSVDTEGVGEPDVDDNVELIVCQERLISDFKAFCRPRVMPW